MRIREPLFFALYWFIGGYTATWFTPWALQTGIGSLLIGLILYRWFTFYEDQGLKTPFMLGCMLVAPPLTLMLIGATWLFLWLVGGV